eukprot:gnl/TRDRNA2_/TRDRNA2_43066_c0_seq1.p1 gnl/TRDRNA2_/TRDRNA2_43066_c0~~gnl/TRDRNA2_/TRDRNA2_43066_c0_seq1.p1  ORF type:complete len:108 (+),score=22.62 gnl/TRDRNA2_/TRDRNA2_43066_c0_seq1:3-326(+)
MALRGMYMPQAARNRSPLVVRGVTEGTPPHALEGKIGNLIAAQLAVQPQRVTPTSSFADLGADSLDTVELLMALEEELGVEIPEEEALKLTTVQDVMKYAKRVTESK